MRYWFEASREALDDLINCMRQYPASRILLYDNVKAMHGYLIVSVKTSQSFKKLASEGYFTKLMKFSRKPKDIALSKYQLDYYAQQNIWFDLYLNFNDNNMRHATACFDNRGYATAKQLHKVNIESIKFIMGYGYSKKDILQYVPEAKYILRSNGGNES